MSTTAAVLGAAAARESLERLGGFDEIVVFEPSVDELERLMTELADPRLDYLLGELPGAAAPRRARSTCSSGPTPADAEVARVLRPDGRAEPAA